MRASLLDSFESRDTIWKFIVACAQDAVREFFWPVRRILGFTRDPVAPELRASRENFRLLKSRKCLTVEEHGVRAEQSTDTALVPTAQLERLKLSEFALARHQMDALSQFHDEIQHWASRYFDDQIRQSKALVRRFALQAEWSLSPLDDLLSDDVDQQEQLIQTFAQLERAAVGIRDMPVGAVSHFALSSACLILTDEALALVIRTMLSENEKTIGTIHSSFDFVRDCVRSDRTELKLLSSTSSVETRKILQLIKQHN